MKSIFSFFLFCLFFIFTRAQQPELITQEKNLGLITKIVYSPDGRYIASVNEKDFTIKVWDIRSDKMIGALAGHEEAVKQLLFNADGTKLYSFTFTGKNYVWNLNEWELSDSLDSPKETEKVLLSDDGKFFYSMTKNNEIVQTDIASKLNLAIVTKVKIHFSDFCLSGDHLIVAGDMGQLLVYDITTQKQISKTDTGKKIHFVFSDGNSILAGYGNELKTFSLEKPVLQNTIAVKSGSEFGFHGKSKQIVFVSPDHQITSVDYSTGKTLAGWPIKNSQAVKSICISPDGSAVAFAGFKKFGTGKKLRESNEIQVWDIKHNRKLHSLQGDVEGLNAFTFGTTENKLYVLRGQELNVWDLNSAEMISSTVLHERKIELKAHADEKVDEKKEQAKENLEQKTGNDLIGIANGGLGGIKDRAKNKVLNTKVEAVQESKEIGRAAFTRVGFQENKILVSKTGKYLITALNKDEIRLYKMNEDIPVHIDFIRTRQKEFYDLIIDPNEKFLVVGGNGDEPVSIIYLDSTAKAIRLDVNDYENRRLGGVFQTANALAFTSDGTKLIAVFNNGRIVVWETKSWYKLTDFRLKAAMTMKPFAGFSKDGSKFFINTSNGVFTYDFSIYTNAPDGKQITPADALGVKKSTIEGFPVMTHVPLDHVISIQKQKVNFLEVQTGEVKSTGEIHAKLITDIQVNKYGYAGISLRNGELRIYDPATGKERFVLVESGDNAIIKTPENYYKVTKEGQDLVTFRVGKDAYPFEQFDAKYNRPDLVLQAMNSEDAGLISLYKSAYEKRLSKLGLKESDLVTDLNLPELKITNLAALPLVTDARKIEVKISAIDDISTLSKIMVWINDVPILGKAGEKIFGNKFEETLQIPLASGNNKIQIAVENAKGTQSLKQTFEVECAVKVKPNLYVVTIGTSIYKDKKYNLNYAAKDAVDVAALFATDANDVYAEVYRLAFTDAQAINSNIKNINTFLSKATIDDVVLVFVAGHGVLDKNMDYYYGTHDIDFAKPAIKGLTYEALEAMLDGIAPLKKMMFMDTCHSGEVEKEEVVAGGEIKKNEKVKFRDVGTGPALSTSSVSPSKVMKELFNDLRRGTGTTVISSSGGTEFAMESDEWKNGLFTYCLLSGMKNKSADADGDGNIMLSELQMYVTEEVSKLSGGSQVPTTRIQNISLDYRVW